MAKFMTLYVVNIKIIKIMMVPNSHNSTLLIFIQYHI
jgi:hypothetical protein